MAKVMLVEDERPRCMSGLFYALKHAKCNKKYKRVIDDQDAFEVLKLFDAKTSHILVDHSNRKRSLKARIKALISEDQDYVSSPKLQRTYSIHHLEANEWVHPIIFFPENVTQRTTSSNCSKTHVNDSRDTLEIFEVDKDTKPKLMPMKLKDKLNESYTILKAGKTKNSNDDICLRRISSNKESTTGFLDFSVSKAALRASRSLKLNGSESLIRNDQNEEKNDEISREITQESPVLVSEYCLQDGKVHISKGFQNKSSVKDDDFTYVKKILERSGFINIGFQQTWYSSNQPLDPFMFQEIESSHRLLIFDLVNDVLVTMYKNKRSFTYYPNSPAPTGSLVLDQVWKNVSRILEFKHDVNESLNDIVSRDLRSDDGWMSWRLDYESVGLDLEDLILDEVLDETVFELL